jgi:hypothetical protein
MGAAIAAIVGFVMVAACGSSPGRTGVAGGSAAGGGGTAGGGAGGAVSSTAVSPGRECTASSIQAAPVDGRIASLMEANGGLTVEGRLLTYPSGSAAPTYSIGDGTLRISENAPATSAPQYLGVVVAFTSCIDASAFTGVQFTMSGSFSGCSMQFATGDVGHQDAATGAPHATGGPGAYPPQLQITADQLSPSPLTLRVPFAGGTTGGSPATPLDPSKLILVLWQWTLAPAQAGDNGATMCTAEISISNLMFYSGASENGSTDGGTAGTDHTEACNALANVGPVVTLTAHPAALPAMTGGQLLDGTYVLTSLVSYAGASPDPETRKETIVIAGEIVQQVYGSGSSQDYHHATIRQVLSGNQFTYTPICPSSPGSTPGSALYTATPTSFAIQPADATNLVLTYSKL